MVKIMEIHGALNAVCYSTVADNSTAGPTLVLFGFITLYRGGKGFRVKNFSPSPLLYDIILLESAIDFLFEDLIYEFSNINFE